MHASSTQRLQWMRQLCDAYAKVEVLDIEAAGSKPSPTYETLKRLKLRYNFTQKPYLIIGADNLSSLHHWYRYEELKEEVVFVIAQRPGYQSSHKFLALDVDYDISSTQLREKLNPNEIPNSIAESVIDYYKE